MKTFRLFISSTFSDFKKERQLLQLKVFPQIKKYCLDKGYKFQPIDLRWGVSNEAQLDQKTLELCLNEVRTCKNHPHPNFLIMIGDRYGWVPLPYIIEKVEFENLLNNMNDYEKSLICEWYREDQNQIPASYILQARSSEFVDYDRWQGVENKLRSILQKAVKAVNLSNEQSRKYYLSATEAEAEEGIIPYHSCTEYQKQLISKNPSINEVDSKYIFGFLRDRKATYLDISDNDCVNAQQFKNRVKQVLPSSNIFHKQIHDVSDESYLAEFEERVIIFLKAQIDSYENNTPTNDREQEIEAQAYFAQHKRKNFLAQESILEAIGSYIAGANYEPLVIYGPSGRGKSSIMAKAIEAAEKTNRKVCYRFIGATPHSSSTKEVLISIMDQLSINIQNNADGTEIHKNFSSIGYKQETFEEFSYRIYDAINALKEEVVILIDAVDQFVNDDQFLWLPPKLPENVKIVISALDDPKYVDDSQYFKILKNKTNNLIEIPIFSEPIRLLRTILNAENRTLQPNQEDYFLEQFNKVQSPLYIIVAAQELKHWRSYDTHLSLADTQHGIIEEFIENLSSIYHHNHAFVYKVLGYIYASRDGLSENEILQLISTDKEFVKQVAPEHFYTNERGELPLVIWTRLYTQLKPFLSSKYQDGEELLYFFHREFEDVVRLNSNQQREHEDMIESTQKLIKQYQNNVFDSNRWGKIHVNLCSCYTSVFDDSEFLNTVITFLRDDTHIDWIESYIHLLHSTGNSLQLQNKGYIALRYYHYQEKLIKTFFEQDNQEWAHTYAGVLDSLALALDTQNKSYQAIELFKKCLEIYDNNNLFDRQDYQFTYAIILNNLSGSYKKVLDWKKSFDYIEKSYQIIIKIDSNQLDIAYRNDVKEVTYGISINYASRLLTSFYSDRSTEAINILLQTIQDIEVSSNHSEKMIRCLIDAKNELALFEKNIDEAKKLLKENLELTKKLFLEDNLKWLGSYTDSLNNLAMCIAQEDRKNAQQYLTIALENLKQYYLHDQERWVNEYIIVRNNFARSLSKLNESSQKSLNYYFESIEIIAMHSQNKTLEAHITRIFNDIAEIYERKDDLQNALKYRKESFEKLLPLYKLAPNQYIESLLKNVTAISDTYKMQKDYLNALSISESLKNEVKNTLVDLPKKYSDEIHFLYCVNLLDRASNAKSDNIKQKIKIYKHILIEFDKGYKQNKDLFADKYIIALDNYAQLCSDKNEILKCDKLAFEISTDSFLTYHQSFESEENFFISAKNYIKSLIKFKNYKPLTHVLLTTIESYIKLAESKNIECPDCFIKAHLLLLLSLEYLPQHQTDLLKYLEKNIIFIYEIGIPFFDLFATMINYKIAHFNLQNLAEPISSLLLSKISQNKLMPFHKHIIIDNHWNIKGEILDELKILNPDRWGDNQ